MLIHRVSNNFLQTLPLLAELNISRENYLIVGSSCAYVCGILMGCGDVDVLLRRPEDFARLAARIPATDVMTNGYRGQTLRFTKQGTLSVEFTKLWPTDDTTEELFANKTEQDGIPYMSLKDYLNALIAFRRQKDEERIPILERILH